MRHSFRQKLTLVLLYSLAMGYLEAAAVVYLRALYYPGGFSFPLKTMPWQMGLVEIGREAATVIMLAAVAALAGKRSMERFGYFLVAFGVWDLSYYFWLKVILDWPASLFDPDILFLIPIPWVGPVIAPALVAALMAIIGILLIRRSQSGGRFRPAWAGWGLGAAATALILYSFVRDYRGAAEGRLPADYSYELLFAGLALYILAYVLSVRNPR